MSDLADTAVPILYVVALAAVWIGSAVITVLKGRKDAFIVGLLLAGAIWLLAALLPARPGSWWDRRARGRRANYYRGRPNTS